MLGPDTYPLTYLLAHLLTCENCTMSCSAVCREKAGLPLGLFRSGGTCVLSSDSRLRCMSSDMMMLCSWSGSGPRLAFGSGSGSESELAFGFGFGFGLGFGFGWLDGVVRLGRRPTEEHANVRVAQVAEQSPLLEQQRARHLALLLIRVFVDHLAGDRHAAPRALDHDPKGASADLTHAFKW